jgi:trk system potassium uptake protein TrkH
MYEFISVFSTVGITTGLTNINTNTGTLVVEMIGMVLGRLEIFIVFIGIYTGFKSLKHLIRKNKGL